MSELHERRVARMATVVCPVCEVEFRRRSGIQRYCSRDCAYTQKHGANRKQSETRQRLARSDAWRESQRSAQRKRWAEGRGAPTGVRACRTCGEDFTPHSGIQRYCSETCLSFGRRALKYGVLPSEAYAIFQAQDGRCALCERDGGGWIKRKPGNPHLVMDHCHRSGGIRGFLCGDCNTAIGRFGDDPAMLRRAAAYLER